EGHPAGLIEAHFDESAEPRAFVGELWVAPAVRHLRGGELLVDTASAWLAGEGPTEIYAWVADANRNAMRFYEALGFGPTGEHRRVVRAPEQAESLLVRHVPTTSQVFQQYSRERRNSLPLDSLPRLFSVCRRVIGAMRGLNG